MTRKPKKKIAADPQRQFELRVRAQIFKRYTIERHIIEKYEVTATSKVEASKDCRDPFEVIVKREKIYLSV